MNDPRSNFLAVSVALTGFDAIDLEATGLVDEYAELCLDILRASQNADQYLQGLQRIVGSNDVHAASWASSFGTSPRCGTSASG
jgi:hypothetical protein